ncbi:transport permease protein [Streptomyces capoamus]|uniref:Transport permease protein n=1 Tax=Streptomyces capoamus TaxID=68183 RepID=A0A919KGB1_9ACTN|nr:ABC transporter permease [Streptomyces capoamus]GGW13130.1 transport permease protein [Streptomyces libani subsp. rufus]GHG77926.1 transport permease protein [Streptomyces capoamus]
MGELVDDVMALTGRHMRHIIRVPEKLIGVTIAPVVMVLIFGYLFGSAMTVPGNGNYREYIMAGIFTMVMFSAVGTSAAGVADDLKNGLVDRFRSLPMSRYAVLLGRTFSDLAMTALSCVVMAAVGLLIGWRAHHGLLKTLAGFGLLLLLGFTMCWFGALIGLVVRSPEAVNTIASLMTMPFAFLSNSFVPLDGLPRWMQVMAEWNPISAVVSGCRQLWGNPSTTVSDALPAQHPVITALLTCGVLLAVVAPLSSRAYNRAAAH